MSTITVFLSFNGPSPLLSYIIHSYCQKNVDRFRIKSVLWPSLPSSLPFSGLLRPQWDKRMRNVLHQVKVSLVSGNKQPSLGGLVKHSWAVSHVWTEGWRGGRQAAQCCGLPLSRPARAPPHKHKQHSHCSLLSANRPAVCQPGRRFVCDRDSTCLCVKYFHLAWEAQIWNADVCMVNTTHKSPLPSPSPPPPSKSITLHHWTNHSNKPPHKSSGSY